jgi:type I restriction enzyme M protein
MIYGQEINHTTYSLARMNMILHGIDVEQFEIFNGDTLLNEWPMLRENRCIFDAIVANPPFAQDLDHEKLANDPRFASYGLPPKGDADPAFLLHGLHYLTDDGTMAIIMSNGVLFRGKQEGKIREKLIKDGNIDAIISLPGGLFFNTSIPVCLIIVKKHRNAKDILFINASNNFHKGQKHNALLPEHISKIIDTYQYRNDCDRYSKKVSIDDIEKDGYNLNVSRYVSTQEPEKEIDLNALHAQLVDLDIESARLKARMNVFMDELGLNPFSSEAKLDELIEAQERNLEILRSYKK